MNFGKKLENREKITATKTGFSLVGTIVAVSLFALIGGAAYGGYAKVLEGVQVLKIKSAATNLANEQIEIVRNLPYIDVGIVDGLPLGKIPRDQSLTREGVTFNVNTSVRDIDDPFDGTIGGDPNDLSPADYKLVEFHLTCDNCRFNEDLKYYARVSPLNLETQGNNGALFVQVIDANGQPLQGANINIFNDQGTTTIDIDETTNNDGMFQIVDAPTGTEAYRITVTKGENYSTDRTYTSGAAENPAPHKPHANVVSGEVTQISFAIDETSDLEIYTRKNTCERIPFVDFNFKGSKTIGVDVHKHDFNEQTGSQGNLSLPDIEWDSYEFTITDSGWDLLGASPLLPLEINPGSNQAIELILTGKEPNALQVVIVDSENDLPITDAQVTLTGSSGSTELETGRGFLIQTDWSGGSAQENFTDNETRYFSNDGGIDDDNPAGDIKLNTIGSDYVSSGILESSTFDTGTTTNYGNIFWNPVDQPTESGEDSLKFQIATNIEITATTTWDFFGPDGASGTYYTSPGEAVDGGHNGDRYLRYKAYLDTDSATNTPSLSNFSFTFQSECTPPGQVLFTDLVSDSYDISVSADGYEDFSIDGVIVNQDWQTYSVSLSKDDE